MLFVNSFTVLAENGENEAYNDADYLLFTGTDFEDESLWGFSAGPGASAKVVESDGNKYLETSGSGNGMRTIKKVLDNPTTKAKVLITFDWRPWDVSTAANSSEILFSDESNNPVFRLVKKGGTNGAIGYSLGTTGTDLSNVSYVENVSTDGKWLSVRILFDFISETISLEIFDKDDSTKCFKVTDLSLKNINYVNRLTTISVIGNRVSGQTLNFKTDLDNIYIYVSEEDVPEQTAKNIVEIVSEYMNQYKFGLGVPLEELISFFPSLVNVKLENGVIVNDVPVSWSCDNYDPELTGIYNFIGTLIIDGISGVKNENNIQAQIEVIISDETVQPPVVEGYEVAYYTDFGDEITVTPKYWGFTTSNATLSINVEDIAGNNTPKLQFSQVNQSGGRVATKKFESAVLGDAVLFKFEWYPGLLNDKGSNPYENGGEIQFFDSSGNLIFTINNTRNEPLKYIVGNNKEVVTTGFVDPERWFEVEVNFDILNNRVTLKLTDRSTQTTESYTSSLEGVSFDGTFDTVRLAGVRTAGNNITWTTYLDNFGVYYKRVPDNRIISVEKLPYHRVYVNTAKTIEEIGLPETVKVTLADGSKIDVPVKRWEIVDKEWSSSEPGIYTFKGILAPSEEVDNSYGKYAICYVYNRLMPPGIARQTEWLDRGAVALKSNDGIFISWRLLIDEYKEDIKFNIYRNGELLNDEPISITNYVDSEGKPGDLYVIETLLNGKKVDEYEIRALETDYISIPLQKPADGENALGEKYSYSANDCSVGDLDGDGEYEIVVKWLPSNAIDSASAGLTGPTIIDAYKLDGTPLWRINLGLNLTSGAHYNQFLVFDFDGDGKSEIFLKTADGTTVYGVTDGRFDENKIISVIGNPDNNGKWIYGPSAPEGVRGKVWGGPEYISVFDGETGKVIDSIEYRFSIENAPVETWGDSWYNRSDRFLAAVAYLNGKTPSAVFGRGYYARTTFVAYDLVDGKLVERWYFDTKELGGRGEGMGNHNLAVADVDNDGRDEIIAGALTLDDDGTILYVMDGEMGREKGSHGDALHVGAFDPDREGIQVVGVREVPAVASLVYYDAATGETLMAFYANKDTGRGVAANITSHPGYEFWGAADPEDVERGAGIYNVQGKVISNNCRAAGVPMNFVLYWDGDLLHELLDDVRIYKYDEQADKANVIRVFEGVVSINGTKANPCLQADILGDWREEVIFPTEDSAELRIYSTTIPTEYRIYTLMHDPVYRLGIAWQNVAYNQPPHISFYLGEDIRDIVLAGELKTVPIYYTNKPSPPGGSDGHTVPDIPEEPEEPEEPGKPEEHSESDEPGEPDKSEEAGKAEGSESSDRKDSKEEGKLVQTGSWLDINMILMLGVILFVVGALLLVTNGNFHKCEKYNRSW